jgi:hypothetical protein
VHYFSYHPAGTRFKACEIVLDLWRSRKDCWICGFQSDFGLIQEGNALVEFPANFAAQVHELFGQWSSRYNTLKDWLGPRRYEETPIGKLFQEDTDPKVRHPCMQIVP